MMEKTVSCQEYGLISIKMTVLVNRLKKLQDIYFEAVGDDVANHVIAQVRHDLCLAYIYSVWQA